MNDPADRAASLRPSASHEPLARRISQFNAWKKSIGNEITRYSMWLHARDRDPQRQQRLQHALRMFAVERLRLVIVGEFSRGKTELINALLARQAQARLFPVRVGRTTMCPVELFYDEQFPPYLKLLPIDSRAQPEPLQYFRRQPEAWFQIDLDANNPESMRQIFREVARTREVKAEQARDLGFELDFLEASVSQPGYVHIPAWRHALINFDHPLLRMGLSIVDTPGINAPGLESDLTADVLPDAQGILYLLSVETGVTASDLYQWNQKIAPIAHANNVARFAVLNKIDLLEADEEPIVESVERLIRMTAQQLEIPRSHVLPLSAKHGLKAGLTGDAVRQRRSGFAHLEQHLVKSVIETRERLLQDDVLNRIVGEVKDDLARVQEEQRILLAEQTQFEHTQADINSDYTRAQRLIQGDQQSLVLRQKRFAQGQQQLQENLGRLATLIGQARYDSHLARARSVLGVTATPTTVASAVSVMVSGVRLDFRRLRSDLESLPQSARRLRSEIDMPDDAMPALDMEQALEQIAALEQTYGSPRVRTETPRDVFENGFLPHLTALYQQIEQRISDWGDSVLQPMARQLAFEQQQIDQRQSNINELEAFISQQSSRLQHIVRRLPDIDKDLHFLQELLFRIEPVEL
jgi:GTPase SAR1 family protein